MERNINEQDKIKAKAKHLLKLKIKKSEDGGTSRLL